MRATLFKKSFARLSMQWIATRSIKAAAFEDGFGATSFNFGIDTDRVTGLMVIPEPSAGMAIALLLAAPLLTRRRRSAKHSA